MTREEAIKELQESLDTLREYDIAHSSRLKQALEMAIQALSQEPCDDAISREDATAEFIKWQTEVAYAFGRDYLGVRIIQSAIDTIRELPSVTQKSCEKCNYKTFTELYFHTDPEMFEPQESER